MSLAWSSVKALTIPVGGTARDVKRVTAGGVTLWEKAPALPYDAEVEYIESTGTQYILTDTYLNYPNDDSNVVAELLFTQTADHRQLMGWNWGAVVGMASSSETVDGSNPSYSLPVNTWHTLETDVKWSETTATATRKCDGVVVRTSTAAASGTATQPFAGFSLYSTVGMYAYICYAKIKRLIGRLNGIVVHDFIPVRIGSIGYLYDKANPTGGPLGNGLYPNSGYGAFVIGPDKNA